jgi:hypothetical protein
LFAGIKVPKNGKKKLNATLLMQESCGFMPGTANLNRIPCLKLRTFVQKLPIP